MGPQLVSVIPTYKSMVPVIPRVIFGIPSPVHILSIPNLASICFKLPSPQLQIKKISGPEKPTGVYQILKTPNIIRYLALHIDCVLHVYLCNGLKFLEISESEYPKYHRSRNIIHEYAEIFAFSFKYKNPTQNVTYDKPNFKEGKIVYLSKIMNLKLSKSE